MFVLGAFGFVWETFLYDWLLELFEWDSVTLYKFYSGVDSVLRLIAWAVIGGGLVGIGAKTK